METGVKEYINSIIELTKNNTIIFTEWEIKHDYVEIEGEGCGPLEKREFCCSFYDMFVMTNCPLLGIWNS